MLRSRLIRRAACAGAFALAACWATPSAAQFPPTLRADGGTWIRFPTGEWRLAETKREQQALLVAAARAGDAPQSRAVAAENNGRTWVRPRGTSETACADRRTLLDAENLRWMRGAIQRRLSTRRYYVKNKRQWVRFGEPDLLTIHPNSDCRVIVTFRMTLRRGVRTDSYGTIQLQGPIDFVEKRGTDVLFFCVRNWRPFHATFRNVNKRREGKIESALRTDLGGRQCYSTFR